MEAVANPYSLSVHSEGNPVLWLTYVSLGIVAIGFLIISVRYWFYKRNSVSDHRDYLIKVALLGLMSLTIGWLGLLADFRRTLIMVATSGNVYWDGVAGAAVSSLRAAFWGTIGFLLALTFCLIVVFRRSRTS
jgi:hypothetical protein